LLADADLQFAAAENAIVLRKGRLTPLRTRKLLPSFSSVTVASGPAETRRASLAVAGIWTAVAPPATPVMPLAWPPTKSVAGTLTET
jgi:hypothetical protein